MVLVISRGEHLEQVNHSPSLCSSEMISNSEECRVLKTEDKVS